MPPTAFTSTHLFQSTSPCGGRHQQLLHPALLSECGFNPRPLAGDDTSDLDRDAGIRLFQSTSPCGGRHAKQVKLFLKVVVSIHVPLRGTTRSGRFARTIAAGFNPRPLAGDDTNSFSSVCIGLHSFNPRPLAGDDTLYRIFLIFVQRFQSTSPCGGRHKKYPKY